ncbi:MAG: hypothetical protein ACREJN_19925 [Nitrospiraceae bacterium]
MRVRLDLAAKQEIRQAVEGKVIYIAAVMHLKRKPGYWVSRGKD